MIRIGVVGFGYWGPNLVRNFFNADESTVTVLCDSSEEQLERARKLHPDLKTTTSYRELLEGNIDAVAVATPVSSHFALAKAALEAGKHVFVEKPMASTVAECEELIELADKKSLVLHVDHTFVYTSAVQRIKSAVQSGEIGELLYYDSTRVNLGLFQHDVNVLWDLAVHDLSILGAITERKPVAVSATGVSHVEGQPENLAFLTVYYDRPLIAHINVNWLAPVKIRQTLIGGTKKMIVFDDLKPSEPIKIYDKGVYVSESAQDIYRLKVGYRSGDMYSPKIELTEALLVEANHFNECVINSRKSLTSGEAGLTVVRILEASEASLKLKGGLVEL